jgi:hypothetical protein
MRSVDQFRPAGPYALTDPRYLRDLDEVRRLGRSDSTERTAEQTALAHFWSDQTAAHTDGNPATAADPTWIPLLTNPPYPDYVSGYNAVAASASKAMEEVLGPRLNLTLTSTAVPGTVRHYRTGRALPADVVDARILLGIHFRFADTAARTLGVDLAEWALGHYFQPVHPHH